MSASSQCYGTHLLREVRRVAQRIPDGAHAALVQHGVMQQDWPLSCEDDVDVPAEGLLGEAVAGRVPVPVVEHGAEPLQVAAERSAPRDIFVIQGPDEIVVPGSGRAEDLVLSSRDTTTITRQQ